MKKKDINIRYIAEKCNVSTATVSRVINDESNVAGPTRQKVLEALTQYGYNAPKAFCPKIKKIGVIMRMNNPDYNAGLLHCISDYFLAKDIQVISSNTDKDYSRIPSALETLYDACVSGIFLISCPYLSIKNCIDTRIPHVWLDCNDSPQDSDDICCTQSDHYASGQMAAMELLKSGCTQPIIITGADCTHRTFDRNKGFFSEYKKHGIELDDDRVIFLPNSKDVFSESREIIRYLLTKNYPFDSIFAISDWRALGAYIGIQNMDLKVPQDIKLIGFDGISLASRSVLNITCIQQNVEQLAYNACVQLDSLMNGQPVKTKHVIIPTDVLMGQTL